MTKILILICVLGLQGCTVLAVADAAGSAVIYAGKTVVNTVDAITPDGSHIYLFWRNNK